MEHQKQNKNSTKTKQGLEGWNDMGNLQVDQSPSFMTVIS